ncbi:hypothetical protein [Siphonobacter aquaeclarae]|uniref:Uncharacterized protein n=1 Tax=Siphonobacter aquaeclarae TaxID=563176 RepID=A0A1G9HIU3_9BACT|nr:hypothetical protein [Siphonobacter aquaeclarae]SDL12789.1 hypothetical protein SAMN04488090_0078 [Siphonobacter aquaeclarae]
MKTFFRFILMMSLSSCGVTEKKVCLPYKGRLYGTGCRAPLVRVTNADVRSRHPDGTENVVEVTGLRTDQLPPVFWFDFRDQTSADSVTACREGVERTVVLTRFSTSPCTIP